MSNYQKLKTHANYKEIIDATIIFFSLLMHIGQGRRLTFIQILVMHFENAEVI